MLRKKGKFEGRKLDVTLGGKKPEKTSQALEWYQGVKIYAIHVRRYRSVLERCKGCWSEWV